MESIATDSGKIVKMEVDYSSTCDEKIPECQKLAKSGKLHDALDQLLALEKQTRTGADMISTGRVLVAICQICKEAKNWAALNEHITLLAKRRSQLKQAVAKMVQECCSYVDETPDKDTRIKLIDTLRQVTEGKIYVEVERARLTHKLAKIREEEGKVQEAANIIQELQVETYGSMEKREKVELILEQMRLCLAKQDYIRTQIISKKINTKFFEDEETQDLKLKYYRLMMEVDQHEGSYLATCKHYRAVLNTSSIMAAPEERQAAAQAVVLYLILAPHENEQVDLTHRVLADKVLEEIPLYKQLLKLFTTPELIKWSGLCELYEKELKATPVFSGNDQAAKRWTDLKIFKELTEFKDTNQKLETNYSLISEMCRQRSVYIFEFRHNTFEYPGEVLRNNNFFIRSRVVEHNIRVMAKYYTRIRISRIAELLDLSSGETEEFLSQMVVSKTVQAKTDRPAGVVHFQQSKDPSDVLNDWAHDLSQLMQLVNKTTHLINKEECVHKHLQVTA